MTRRNLVVLRAGEKSLHREWFSANAADRTWDLVVSWYGQSIYTPVQDEKFVPIKGGKWDGLYKTFELMPEVLDRYDYVWLPDDDIRTNCRDINRMFELMHEEKLLVGQPALTWSSYFTHLHTLWVPGLHLRYTNMVEVMISCLDARFLRSLLPLFKDNMMGWGIDWIWCRASADNRERSAIFDCVQMHHTRPTGTQLLGIVRSKGEDPNETRVELLAHYGLARKKLRAICYAAFLRGRAGRTSKELFQINRGLVSALMALSYLAAMVVCPSRRRIVRKWPAVVRRFPLNLSQLPNIESIEAHLVQKPLSKVG
jgi:hypothetical protein